MIYSKAAVDDSRVAPFWERSKWQQTRLMQ